jgi:hypothetical protein
MAHDQLFKEFLREFFQDFLELFYPDAASRLDFRTLKFLDKELFTDFPEGSMREADVVAQIQTHEGEPELILVHIEVQSRPEKDFEQRMFQYFALLWLRYQIPIYPVAVFLRGGEKGLTEDRYRVTLFGREQLRFRYESVGLGQLDAQEYVKKRNPVAASLAALMRRPKTDDNLTLRALMVQHVAESDLDDARKFLLVNIIESYFELAANEEEDFHRLLLKAEYREAQKMELTWADKMKEEGRLAGKRETLLQLLSKKFGPLPEEATTRVNTLESIDELDAYLDRVLTASSLEEMGLNGR